jgi:hypothetical protein
MTLYAATWLDVSPPGGGFVMNLKATTTILVLSSLLVSGARAASAPWEYSNGFENAADVDSASYPNDAMFSTQRLASGIEGIAANIGAWYGKASVDSGAFTRYGGYSSTFPADGYTTSVDIYLPATSDLDRRFDWSSAVSTTTATTPGQGFRRDFVFNAASTGDGDWVIAATNNATRSGANPNVNPERVKIQGGSWYTFQHRFSGVNGVLSVDMTLIHTGVTIKSWTRSDPSDVIGQTVGGNRYGWLVSNELPLALDNVIRSGALYGFFGFSQPIDNGVTNLAKAGQTVPVKWRLVNSSGNPVSDPNSFAGLTSKQVSCSNFADDLSTDTIESYTNSTGLTYQGDGSWQFNWQTPKTYAAQCRLMTLRLSDGAEHDADFQFKK